MLPRQWCSSSYFLDYQLVTTRDHWLQLAATHHATSPPRPRHIHCHEIIPFQILRRRHNIYHAPGPPSYRTCHTTTTTTITTDIRNHPHQCHYCLHQVWPMPVPTPPLSSSAASSADNNIIIVAIIVSHIMR
jgi:hypothetical protein